MVLLCVNLKTCQNSNTCTCICLIGLSVCLNFDISERGMVLVIVFVQCCLVQRKCISHNIYVTYCIVYPKYCNNLRS